MICSDCGAQNRPDRRFCLQCGTALAQGCATCGAANEPEARFCGNCGHPLVEAGGQPASGQRLGQPAMAQPTTGQPAGGPATAAQPAAMAAPSAAERRLVTVLFADLVGFTPFAEERDAEEVRATLQHYFDLARQVIERYGGTVEKFIGDAVMAVWGTPTAHEDDAERAVRAALDLLDAVRTLGAGVDARVGVLTGEAAVSIGATDQGLLAGDLVNTAARLQSVAPPGTVLVGESTMRAAAAALTFEPAGEHVLKGKAAPLAAWRALRVVAQRRGAGRSDILETPFVGRQEEFRLLRELLHAGARDPRPRLVSVTGPAGIGKSRLAWELEKYVDGLVERIYWHRGRCPAYGEGITFWALGEMVRGRAQLAESDDEATTRQRLTATVDEYVAESERGWILSALLALLDIEPAPQGGREMLFAAWRRFFESIAARGTTVLVFEDLQWADSGLLDLIDHLLDWSKAAPLLIVTLARPELFERRPNWGAGRRTYTAMALDPLSEDAMRELLTALVAGLDDDALRAVVGRADGIPLYAVETVRMLAADGRLEQVDNGFRPTRALDDLAVPDSLRALITARLDDLDPADRVLLQDAAVLGQTFTLDALAAISGDERDDLEARLRGLIQRELLVLEADPRSPERGNYGFVQSLTREVAYSTLARPERRARHLAAARHFESVGGDEIAGVLAGHYVAAHEASAAGPEGEAVATQARLALRGAAERAAALGSHEQAADYLAQAAAVTDELAERAQLLLREAYEADLAGRYERAEARARQAIERHESVGDVAGAARARGLLGTILIHTQHAREAIAELEPALGQLGDDADPAVRADVLAKLARAYYRNLEPESSVETADRALIIAEHHALPRTVGEAMVSKGSAMTMLGRTREAMALLRAGVELAKREGDIDSALRGMANVAYLIASLEGADEAMALAREAYELARTVGDRGQMIWHLGNLAIGATFSGWALDPILAEVEEGFSLDLEEADRHQLRERWFWPAMFRGLDVTAELEQWLRETEARADPQNVVTAMHIRGIWAFVRGQYGEASQHFEKQAEQRNDLGLHSLAALIAAMDGDVQRSAQLLETALDGPVGPRTDEAFRAATHAALAALDGRREQALPAFRESLRLLYGIGSKLEAGYVTLTMLRTLGSGDPEARQAAEEARKTFEHMGSEPMLRQLTEALGGEPVPSAR